MISDEDVKQLFFNGRSILAKQDNNNGVLLTQFFRGVMPDSWDNQLPGACNRHMALFKRLNIITNYCFSCYKVIIEPRTVIELFKLMMIFEGLQHANDNTRKCLVEGRPQIPGTYKGIIYCRSIEKGEKIAKMNQALLSENISSRIPVAMKRGCSEYVLSYPEYARIGKGAAAMEYKKEWQEYEDLADKHAVINRRHHASDTHNRPAYTLEDYQVMVTWLKYAATIRDESYINISG